MQINRGYFSVGEELHKCYRISSNISRGFSFKNEILFLYLDLYSSPPIFIFRYSKLPFIFGFVYPGANKRVQIPITGNIISRRIRP